MKVCRSRVGVAVLAGQLYAIGGYDGCQRLKTVEMYSPDTNEWSTIPPMNMKVTRFIQVLLRRIV